jgi:two-component system response regulator YesN
MQELLPHVVNADLMNTLYEDSQQLSLIADEQGLLSLSKWKQQLILGFHQLSQLLLQHQHKENKVIYEICSYIEKHYQENLTLQHISNQFFISREYISRKFKQEFKVNFSDYMSRIRIEKSKLLLLNPHLRIAKIAEEVGYPDVKYFSKVFKKIVGVSPNQFRKENTSI